MKRRPLLVVTGWLVAALAATGAGVVVTTFLGESMTGSASRALSAPDVRRALDATPPASPAVPGGVDAQASRISPTPPPGAAGQTTAIPARGGVVVAQCAGGLVTLLSWTPAQGYEVREAEPGPRAEAWVKFEAEDDETEIEIHCSGERPVAAVEYD